MNDYNIEMYNPYQMTIETIVKPTSPIIRIYEGQEAYCVEIGEWPNPGIVDWCRQQYGMESMERWFIVNNIIVFENDEDRAWFILRWSS